jgi:hypothetical protein
LPERLHLGAATARFDLETDLGLKSWTWGNYIMSNRIRIATIAALVVGSVYSTAAAAQVAVSWADLTSASPGGVTGSIDADGTPIGVTFSGAYGFAQTDGTGTYYWTEGTPAPYTGGIVDNAPPTTDIIALDPGGLKTITFSQAVSDVYLALISWNGNAGTFDQPFDVISEGCGYWGCGSFTSVTPTSFVASGELHGVIRFTGTFTSVSFTDLDENWHGIQIGIGSVAPPPPVPEPAGWAMMIGGFTLAGGAMRRRTGGRIATA